MNINRFFFCVLSIALFISMLMFSGCNTLAGMGEDIQDIGRGITGVTQH